MIVTGPTDNPTLKSPVYTVGSSRSFDYPFQIQKLADLLVLYRTLASGNAAAGTAVYGETREATVVSATNIGADAGGSVEIRDVLIPGSQLVVLYRGDYRQEEGYHNQVAIRLEQFEGQLDKLTMTTRSHREILDRAITVNPFEPADIAETIISEGFNRGPQGDPGAPGAPGAPGDPGDPGPQGARGNPGPMGDQGETGSMGARGEQGVVGPRGERGTPGVADDLASVSDVSVFNLNTGHILRYNGNNWANEPLRTDRIQDAAGNVRMVTSAAGWSIDLPGIDIGAAVAGDTFGIRVQREGEDIGFQFGPLGFGLTSGAAPQTPRASIDLSSRDDMFLLPRGDTANEPTENTVGGLRLDTTRGVLRFDGGGGFMDVVCQPGGGEGDGDGGDTTPEILRQLADHLTVTTTHNTDWRVQDGAGAAARGVRREWRSVWDGQDIREDDWAANQYEDVDGIVWTAPTLASDFRYYYENADTNTNYWRGEHSYVILTSDARWTVLAHTPDSADTADLKGVLVAFSTRLQRAAGPEFPSQRLLSAFTGDGSEIPLLRSDHDLGVAFRLPRGGTTRSGTRDVDLATSPVGGVITSGDTSADFSVHIPQDGASSAYSFIMQWHLVIQGNSGDNETIDGALGRTFRITNRNANQDLGDVVFAGRVTQGSTTLNVSTTLRARYVVIGNDGQRVAQPAVHFTGELDNRPGVDYIIRPYRSETYTYSIAADYINERIGTGGSDNPDYLSNHPQEIVAHIYPMPGGRSTAEGRMDIAIRNPDNGATSYHSLSLGREFERLRTFGLPENQNLSRAFQCYTTDYNKTFTRAELLDMVANIDDGLGLYTNVDRESTEFSLTGDLLVDGAAAAIGTIETGPLDGEQAEPYVLNLGAVDLNANITGLTGFQILNSDYEPQGGIIASPSATTRISTAALGIGRIQLIFTSNGVHNNIPVRDGVGSVTPNGGIILPRGYHNIEAGLSAVGSGLSGTNAERMWGALAIRDSGGEAYSQALYLRNSNDSNDIRRTIKGKVSVSALVYSDGITPISVTLTAAAQQGNDAIRIYGARVRGVAQLVGGIRGEAGKPGAAGGVGPRGERGLPGNPGTPGLRGERGIQGNPGAPGEDGDLGPRGIQGIQGIRGAAGSTGPRGLQGVPGTPGERGLQGIRGLTGQQGVPGDRGPTGLRGQTGQQGPSGDSTTIHAINATGADIPAGSVVYYRDRASTTPQITTDLRSTSSANGGFCGIAAEDMPNGRTSNVTIGGVVTVTIPRGSIGVGNGRWFGHTPVGGLLFGVDKPDTGVIGRVVAHLTSTSVRILLVN